MAALRHVTVSSGAFVRQHPYLLQLKTQEIRSHINTTTHIYYGRAVNLRISFTIPTLAITATIDKLHVSESIHGKYDVISGYFFFCRYVYVKYCSEWQKSAGGWFEMCAWPQLDQLHNLSDHSD